MKDLEPLNKTANPQPKSTQVVSRTPTTEQLMLEMGYAR